jgi:hypothetical protein
VAGLGFGPQAHLGVNFGSPAPDVLEHATKKRQISRATTPPNAPPTMMGMSHVILGGFRVVHDIVVCLPSCSELVGVLVTLLLKHSYRLRRNRDSI